MIGRLESFELWARLADYYVFASLILGLSIAARSLIKQPARRLAVAWSTSGGLLLLAALTLLSVPLWPKIRVLGPRETLERASVSNFEPSSTLSKVEKPTLSETIVQAERQRRPVAQPATGLPVPIVGVEDIREPSSAPLENSWVQRVSAAFFLGSALMLGWLALGAWQAAVLRRRSRPAPSDAIAALAEVASPDGVVGSAPELRISDSLRQPVALGVWRPTIILPSRFLAAEPRSRLKTALAHEWAHIRSRDLWLIALLRLLLPMLYAHPLYWRLRRRIRDDQEAIADASAALIAGRLNYAEILLSWLQDAPRRSHRAAGGAVALFERTSQIKRRILMLLDADQTIETTCPAWWRRAIPAAMILAVFAVSTLTLRPVSIGAESPSASAGQGNSVILRDPAGKPLAGAKIHLSGVGNPKTAILLGTTGPDGSFRRRKLTEAEARSGMRIVATAEGYGPALADPKADADSLAVAEDDVPIQGRVLDEAGWPVAGASAQVAGLLWHPGGKLDDWLAKLAADKEFYPSLNSDLSWWATDDVESFFSPAVTDDQGRFTIRGIGRERIAVLIVSGPNLGTRMEYVAARRMPAVKYPDFRDSNFVREVACRGADCEITLRPGLEAQGSVTDKDTGQPLAGAIVRTAAMFGNPLRTLKTTTDAQGRYRLSGIPLQTDFNDEQQLLVSLDARTYLPAIRSLGEHKSPASVALNFQLKHGIRVKGRVIDGATGAGVAGGISYYILESNPHLKAYEEFGTPRVTSDLNTDDQGRFEMVIMPGPGVIAVRASEDGYRMGVGTATIPNLEWADAAHQIARTVPTLLVPANYHTLIGIAPQAGDAEVEFALKLDRGRSVAGKIVGPDGQPLAGALIEGLEDFRIWSRKPLASADFSAQGIAPGVNRELLALHESKNLAGAYIIKPEEKGPITLKLAPAGIVTGRLVDKAGAPLSGVDLTCHVPLEGSTHEAGSLPSAITTGADGRFRAQGLVPGLKYAFRIWRGNQVQDVVSTVIVAAGETKDLGDLTPQPGR